MLVWSPDDTPEDAGRVILNAIFGVRDASEIPMEANALFPVFNEDTGRYEKPDCAARRTDYVPLGTVRGVPVGHVPMGAFTQPCDWANRGLECDKMSREAVRFHLDAVFAELHRRLGPDLRAAGLTHILLDSYEAGTPTWTPEMPAEFRRRRGYDPTPYLPILGGYTNLYTAAEAVPDCGEVHFVVRPVNEWGKSGAAIGCPLPPFASPLQAPERPDDRPLACRAGLLGAVPPRAAVEKGQQPA